jgi:hypothetical protein
VGQSINNLAPNSIDDLRLDEGGYVNDFPGAGAGTRTPNHLITSYPGLSGVRFPGIPQKYWAAAGAETAK